MASLNPACYVCNQTTSSDHTIKRISPDIECHPACLKCHQCGIELEEDTTCYIEENKVYCKTDYTQLFCKRCVRCGQLFDYEEEAFRVKSMYYHDRCFRCDSCQAAINPKSPFVISHAALFCNEDHFNMCSIHDIKEEAFSPHTSTSSSSSSLSQTTSNKPHKSSTGIRTQQEKQTRVRTVLNEQQLSVLRQYYATNARPDAVMKDQLVELTGLRSRVIRVWFQNKRCKDKKKVLMDQRKSSQSISSLPKSSLQHEERGKGVNDKTSSPETQPFSADAYLGFPCGQDDQPFSPWSDPVDIFTQPANLTSSAEKP
ncbi:Islet (Isl) LIM-Homeobox containing transcription factor [Oopsacas minuta]|uniref:Islet (Isl) LIM-Homeobox containing transcription factor n=1 Tax=Oopsacas minuta TaxID=111878 RepID=A0AAV7K3V8_9METZ|nr:Islet (Isl) LIM-Homeobox containing transcription factor [Oopsacas minuta]